MPVDVTSLESRNDYPRMIERVRQLIRAGTPAAAAVLVVSRGDGMLVNLAGWDLRHFPQSPTGLYAGHYPADGEAAVAHLKELRALGAQYLMIPGTGLWWLDHYRELGAWLEEKASVVADEPGTGRLFRLAAEREADPGRPLASEARTARQISRLLRSLLPPGAGVVLIGVDAESVEVDDRPAWLLSPPRADNGTSVAHVLAAVDVARSSGGQYAALLIPEDRPASPDGALRRELGRRYRCVCAQRLVELFAVAADGDAGA